MINNATNIIWVNKMNNYLSPQWWTITSHLNAWKSIKDFIKKRLFLNTFLFKQKKILFKTFFWNYFNLVLTCLCRTVDRTPLYDDYNWKSILKWWYWLVHIFHYPRLDKNVGFWLVNDSCIQNPCTRLVVM